jgi:PAS domain S-box-containing protein
MSKHCLVSEIQAQGIRAAETQELQEIVTVVHALTERKTLEEALQKSEALFRGLSESSPVGIFFNDANGNCTYTNERWQKIYGLSLEESLGDGWSRGIHPEDRASVFAGWITDAQAGREFSREFRILTPQGELRWVHGRTKALRDHQGIVIGHVGTTEDITGQKQAETALRESEERFRDLFDSASDIIVTVTPDDVITNVNRAAEQLLGWSRAESIGQKVRMFIAPTSLALQEERGRRLRAGEHVPEVFEIELLRKDGLTVPIEAHARFLYDLEGNLLQRQVILRDLSARKALERQRAEFLAMLTHDIKNPLGAIMGYTEMLLDHAKARGEKEEEEMLKRQQANTTIILSLVANYLVLSRFEAGQLTVHKQPLLLNELLERVGYQYHGEAQRQGCHLLLHLPDESPVVEGDIASLERAFSNLLHNALKFTPEGGQVTVSVRSGRKEIAIMVSDSGSGIAPNDLPTIFDKYTRGAAQRHEGAGLGLFIVKTLVEAHGGRVEVESELGEGSCFTVWLPMMVDGEVLRTGELVL